MHSSTFRKGKENHGVCGLRNNETENLVKNFQARDCCTTSSSSAMVTLEIEELNPTDNAYAGIMHNLFKRKP